MWFFYDYYYLILVVPAMIIAMIAQLKVTTTFNKYDKLKTMRGVTGYESARMILDKNGLSHVKIEHVRGHLTDHYDPKANVIRLSESVYNSTSTAAVGVAAHEAGHAVQYAKNYAPIRLRSAIIPVTRFGSMLAMPLFFIGLLLASEPFMLFGILLYAAVALFQLVTLPVEFNASDRAIKALDSSKMLTGEELVGARQVLSAAAMTYVAALLTSLLTLLRLLVIVNGRSNRR